MTEEKKYKIEGLSFEIIKEKRTAYINELERAKKAKEELHKAFWDEIYKALPDLDKNDLHSLNAEYEGLGFFIVEKADSDCLGSILGSLLKNIKK